MLSIIAYYSTHLYTLVLLICICYIISLLRKNYSLKERNEQMSEVMFITNMTSALSDVIRDDKDVKDALHCILSTVRDLLTADAIILLKYRDGLEEILSISVKNPDNENLMTAYTMINFQENKNTSSIYVKSHKLSDNTYINTAFSFIWYDNIDIIIAVQFLMDKELKEEHFTEYGLSIIPALRGLIIQALETEKRRNIDNIIQAKNESDKKAIELAHQLSRELEYKQLQNDFISLASHEFRTPLAVIGSSLFIIQRNYSAFFNKIKEIATVTELQRYEELFHKNNNLASNMQSYIKHLSSMIDSTLKVAIMEEHGITSHMQNIQIRPILDAVVSKLEHLRNDVDIIIQDHSNNCYIRFDPMNLELVITNLISNAIKYSRPDTSILITLQQIDGILNLFVIDKGIGIPKEQRSKMFQKFFRGSNTCTITGIGVGLYLTKKLVEANNASISFKSRKNVGTEFRVCFDVVEDI